MILFKRAAELSAYLEMKARENLLPCFIPTMGALHQGHLSLIEAAKASNGITVCSIFVNPTQFNDPGDYAKYPITIENDIYLLETHGVDILFLPSVPEIYHNGTAQLEHYDLGYLETILEGKYRPGHFQGVCQVMYRLLNIVKPAHLFMGQKDYQQCMVIQKMTAQYFPSVSFHVCPTLREPDGLAMSSRNMRLNETERAQAPAIFRALTAITENMQPGDTSLVIVRAKKILDDAGFKTDYIEIADAHTLTSVPYWDGKQKTVQLIAAFQHEVRLIDNMLKGDELNLK